MYCIKHKFRYDVFFSENIWRTPEKLAALFFIDKIFYLSDSIEPAARAERDFLRTDSPWNIQPLKTQVNQFHWKQSTVICCQLTRFSSTSKKNGDSIKGCPQIIHERGLGKSSIHFDAELWRWRSNFVRAYVSRLRKPLIALSRSNFVRAHVSGLRKRLMGRDRKKEGERWLTEQLTA